MMRSTLRSVRRPERQPGVDAGGEAADQAGPQHELVADDLGFGRGFLEGVDRVLGQTHGGPGIGGRVWAAAAKSCSLRGAPYDAALMSTEPTLPRPRSRGVYLLPNLLTTGCLFSGFYAIVAAIDGNFERAGIAIFVAMLFDDARRAGRAADHTESAFGKEYDSLADMVSFGVAPRS